MAKEAVGEQGDDQGLLKKLGQVVVAYLMTLLLTIAALLITVIVQHFLNVEAEHGLGLLLLLSAFPAPFIYLTLLLGRLFYRLS